MGHQLTVVVLEVSQHVRDIVIDIIGRAVADIYKVRFLDHDKNLLLESLLHSRHLLEQTHYIGVYNQNVGIRVGSCAVRDDKRNWLSQVDEGSG